jgi:hypothetical protein
VLPQRERSPLTPDNTQDIFSNTAFFYSVIHMAVDLTPQIAPPGIAL